MAWAVGLVVYFALAAVRADLGTVLILIAAWQTLFYVAWRGWPFTRVETRWRRLTCAHVVVIAAGVLTFLVIHGVLGVGREPLAAYAGCFVAAALLLGMLLDSCLNRSITLIAAVALAAVLALALYDIAGSLRFARASTDAWVTHVTLNAISMSVLLHVAVGRRWPFDTGTDISGRTVSVARGGREPRRQAEVDRARLEFGPRRSCQGCVISPRAAGSSRARRSRRRRGCRP